MAFLLCPPATPGHDLYVYTTHAYIYIYIEREREREREKERKSCVYTTKIYVMFDRYKSWFYFCNTI